MLAVLGDVWAGLPSSTRLGILLYPIILAEKMEILDISIFGKLAAFWPRPRILIHMP